MGGMGVGGGRLLLGMPAGPGTEGSPAQSLQIRVEGRGSQLHSAGSAPAWQSFLLWTHCLSHISCRGSFGSKERSVHSAALDKALLG